jgi:c(7)-type cytochrome triheme protein
MKRRGAILLLLVTTFASVALSQTFGVKKRTPKPDEYGNVVMRNFAARVDSDPVVFPHWLHRAKYTCRLCHVDLGFAMTAGETMVSEEDNNNGLYCGACHNGTVAFPPEETVEGSETVQHCDRCHSYDNDVELEYEFYEFVKDFPRSRFGNRVDWLQAEEDGLVTLVDYLEGISIEGIDLMIPEDRQIHARVIGMPSIIFSHEKHTVWSGCELCHPQIFGIRKRAQAYDMQDIFDGKFCGACHGKVAFPNTDCRLCHTETVF